MKLMPRWCFLLFVGVLSIATPVFACTPHPMTDEKAAQVIHDAFYIGMVRTVEVDIIDSSLYKGEIRYVLEPVRPYTNPYWEPITVREIGINSCYKHPAEKGETFEAVIFKTENGFRLGDQREHAFTGYRWEKLREQAEGGGFAAEEANRLPSKPYAVTEETAKGFLRLFHEAKKIAHSGPQVASLGEEAEAYIRACCDSINAAVALLKEAGFQIRYTDDPEWVEHLNRSYQSSHGQTYDRFIGGSRSAGWWPFWDAITEFSVSLLIKGNQIEDVSAQVTMESPP